MAKKTPGKLSLQQKRKIAGGKLAGKSQREIAREAACSVSSVSHAGNDPVVRGLIAEASEVHRDRLLKLYARMLASVEKDLASKAGADRQAARSEAVRLMMLADQAAGVDAAPQAGETSISLQELLIAYHRREG